MDDYDQQKEYSKSHYIGGQFSNGFYEDHEAYAKEKKSQPKKRNKHNRAATTEDREDCKLNWDFINQVKVSQKKRNKHFNSLYLNMKNMDKKIKSIVNRKGGINVTIVAEKPNVAEVIAKVLSNDEAEPMSWKKFSRYEFYGYFRNVYSYFRVLSVYGHIYK